MKAEIVRIKVKLKDREIELTAQEARELQTELNKLFEMEKSALQKLKEEWEKDNPKKEYVPYPVYPSPIIIDRTPPSWPHPWQIWCTPNTGTPTPHLGDTICMSLGAS